MKSPGSGSSKPPQDAQPQGPVTPYGQASPFNPQYQSILPMGPGGQPDQMATAQLSDQAYEQGGPRTPLLDQQEATSMASTNPAAKPPGSGIEDKKMMLALLLANAQSPDKGYNVARGMHGVG